MTPAEQARRSAGYSLQELARKINRTPRRLRDYERQGRAPWGICERLGMWCRCSPEIWFYTPEYLRERDRRLAAVGTHQGQTEAPSATDRPDTTRPHIERLHRAVRRHRNHLSRVQQ